MLCSNITVDILQGTKQNETIVVTPALLASLSARCSRGRRGSEVRIVRVFYGCYVLHFLFRRFLSCQVQ